MARVHLPRLSLVKTCVHEIKYEGIIKVCKPDSKADGIDVTATCIDTDKLMTTDAGSTDDKIVQLMSDIDNLVNNSKGVIIVCFCMYEQINTFTLRILALLHKSLGSTFWNHVVIALTKADQYGEDGPKSNTMRETFAETVEQNKKQLKEKFTTANKAKSECFFGMSERLFDE